MSTLAQSPAPPVSAEDRKKRSVRNYLLDARFQLKFTLYIVAVAVVVAALLGIFLWRTSQALFSETAVAVEARSQAAEKSKELGQATLSNQLLEKFDDPDFARQLQEKSKEIDAQYKDEEAAIIAQRAELLLRQKVTFFVLLFGFVGFVVFIGLATIVTTHKIVGPLYRMKRMAQTVAAGRLELPAIGLRPGDELKDLFEEFTSMIRSLRDAQEEEIRALEGALAEFERSGASPEAVSRLKGLQAQMKKRLE